MTAYRDRLRADRATWAQARSLTDLGELTAQWLEGSILHQPGYSDPGPGETETACIAALLAACCRAGFVTAASQPGTSDWARAGRPNQRAAVEGFCDSKTFVRLVPAADAAGLIVITHGPSFAPRWRSRYRECIPVTLGRRGEVLTSFGAHRCQRELRGYHTGYGECHKDAVKAVTSAWQVTLIEREWGRNAVLWAVLERFAGVTP